MLDFLPINSFNLPEMFINKLRPWVVPVVGLAATVTLAGCTLFPSPTPQLNVATPTSRVDTPEGSVNISGNDENVTISGESDNTSFSFGQGLPNDWPNDLPTPSNATVAFAASEEDTAAGKTTYSATFAIPTTSDPSSILGQLKSAYEQAGWSISNESLGTFGLTAGGFDGKKGQNTVTVAFLGISGTGNAEEEGATLTIAAEYAL